jgi:hypothetical protein
MRQFPEHFTSAFGAKIMGCNKIVDVRKRCVLSGPATNYPGHPIYFPVGGDRVHRVFFRKKSRSTAMSFKEEKKLQVYNGHIT